MSDDVYQVLLQTGQYLPPRILDEYPQCEKSLNVNVKYTQCYILVISAMGTPIGFFLLNK